MAKQSKLDLDWTKDQLSGAFIDRIRALGHYERGAGMVQRLRRALAKKLTAQELNDLLVLVTVIGSDNAAHVHRRRDPEA